jgi:hypothetical protein
VKDYTEADYDRIAKEFVKREVSDKLTLMQRFLIRPTDRRMMEIGYKYGYRDGLRAQQEKESGK